MEQLQLRAAEFNHCTQEKKYMSATTSERQQAIEAKRNHNKQIKLLVDAFFETLSTEQRTKKLRWTLAARYLNQLPEGTEGRTRPWLPQGVAKVCKLAEMWANRQASPAMVTPERRKIFRLISQLTQDGQSWFQIADILNRKGFTWKPLGRTARPFTHRSANDFFRHHQHLWPIRTRKSHQVQQAALNLTSDPPAKRRPRTVQHVVTTSPVPGPVKRSRRVAVSKLPDAFQKLSDDLDGDGDIAVFKHRFDTTSIEVLVKDHDGSVSVLVRYSGKSNTDVTNQVTGLVRQLQGFDYRS